MDGNKKLNRLELTVAIGDTTAVLNEIKEKVTHFPNEEIFSANEIGVRFTDLREGWKKIEQIAANASRHIPG